MKEVLKFELIPMPLSMFKTDGNPRIISNKADLMNLLQVEVSTRTRKAAINFRQICDFMDNIIIQWPSSNGTMTDYIKRFSRYVMDLLS